MRRRVLLIEDDVQMLEELSNIFKKHKIAPLMANCGKDGLELAQAKTFDVAVIDIKLPDTSGVELISKLKKRRPHAAYILMTAYASLETAVKAVRKGATEYLLKPFDPDELLRAVERGFLRKDANERCRNQKQRLLNENEILEKKLSVLRHLNEIHVGRERAVIALKKEVNELLTSMDRENKYEGI